MFRHFRDGAVTVIRANPGFDPYDVEALVRREILAGQNCSLLADTPSCSRLAAFVKVADREYRVTYPDRAMGKYPSAQRAAFDAAEALQSMLSTRPQ